MAALIGLLSIAGAKAQPGFCSMPPIHPIQLLLGVFIGLALGLAVPELWRSCHHAADSPPAGAQDDALLGLLLLAAFALGTFTAWIIRDLF